jgi:hypothetical protein
MIDSSSYILFVVISAWKHDSLLMMIFVNVWTTWRLVERKTRFETWKRRKNLIGVRLFHLTYLIALMAYLCSQRTQNFQDKYFMFDSSIYILVELNSSRKHDSLQMMKFVKVCCTLSMVELKTRIETWITRKDVKCVCLFHLPYLIKLMVYLCSQWTPNVQIKYFMFDLC